MHSWGLVFFLLWPQGQIKVFYMYFFTDSLIQKVDMKSSIHDVSQKIVTLEVTLRIFRRNLGLRGHAQPFPMTSILIGKLSFCPESMEYLTVNSLVYPYNIKLIKSGKIGFCFAWDTRLELKTILKIIFKINCTQLHSIVQLYFKNLLPKLLSSCRITIFTFPCQKSCHLCFNIPKV